MQQATEVEQAVSYPDSSTVHQVVTNLDKVAKCVQWAVRWVGIQNSAVFEEPELHIGSVQLLLVDWNGFPNWFRGEAENSHNMLEMSLFILHLLWIVNCDEWSG